MNEKNKLALQELKPLIDGFLVLLTQGALFVSLVSWALYHYPNWDEAIYHATDGSPYFVGLTAFHMRRFGGIHIPTAVLMLWVLVAVLATPYLARVMFWSMDRVYLLWKQEQEALYEGAD